MTFSTLLMTKTRWIVCRVYDNDAPTTGWDGDYNDEPSPAEVYAYYLEILVNECIKVAKKGNVTLMR
jgi:hypothetical protein